MRSETAGLTSSPAVLHFNNAGSSLMPSRVLDATVDHLRMEAEVGGCAQCLSTMTTTAFYPSSPSWC